MPRLSCLALAAALLASGATVTGAVAQTSTTMEFNGRVLSVTAREMKALGDVRATFGSRSAAAQDRALAAAARTVQGRDARHVLAAYQLQIAGQRNDDAMRAQALDVLIASDLTTAESLASFLAVRGGIAYRRGDLPLARTLWARLAELRPDDPGVLANLAQVDAAGSDPARAIESIRAAIARQSAGGARAPETLYRQWLSLANQARQTPAVSEAALALLRAYPTQRNWRDGLVVYRQVAQPTGANEIELLRLMRTAGVLARADEYHRLAQLLNQGGASAEARRVLDEGVSRGVLDRAAPLTRQIAAEIDRDLARRRAPAGDPALSGLQRSATLAALGRRDEARAVFEALAVDGGAARDLARFWLAWLERPPR